MSLRDIITLMFVLTVVVAAFLLGSLFWQTVVAGREVKEALENLHLAWAVGLSATATVFFAIQQLKVVRASTKEFELKQSPPIEFSEFQIKDETEERIEIQQSLTNMGLGNVYISAAIINWGSSTFLSDLRLEMRGSCQSKLPTKIEPGSIETIVFRITKGQISDGVRQEVLAQVKRKYPISHIVDAEVTYYVTNAGASEPKIFKRAVYFNELSIAAGG